MDEAIRLECRYQERGKIGLKRSEENVMLFLDITKDLEIITERQTEFETTMRKAISLFSRDSIWNCELTFYFSTSFYNEERYALVCRDASDRENDVYTLYKYGRNQTDIQKVSKAKLLKELLSLEKENVEMLLASQQGVEEAAS